MNEHIIIQNCLRNDRKCQKMLYELYHQLMMAVCLRYCKDEYMAQEALQNGFIRVFSGLHTYDSNKPFGPWIRKIMINCCLDQLSRKSVMANLDDIMPTESTTIHDPEFEITDAGLTRLIESMPIGYRTVFSMYVIDEMSHLEIAEALQISEATSRSQLFKARNYLKAALTNKRKLFL
ncbi:MAG TPA: sigma-70 family RNA polymerase sigma factor [Saprospiraceae bacterium]|nr:sigma-70 family RNA polymerase sigma factor [Saprospiraceae bacterium]HRP84946.1 sigma-70 family RNA polymerase sigma factor [Saprospiraceae bacterium]